MPSTPRRTQAQRRADTQGRLYGAALESLLERGYAAMTLADVTKRAGLSSGALWRYCKTKADLAYAAVRHASEEEWLESSRTLPADVDGMISVLLREPADDVGRGNLELLRAATTDEQLRALMAEGSWAQWLEWSATLQESLGVTLDERTAGTIRVLALATLAMRLLFRDEDMAAVLHGDIELAARELLKDLEP